jgi:OmcA/MtrC family decaheme c-type cytochrome
MKTFWSKIRFFSLFVTLGLSLCSCLGDNGKDGESVVIGILSASSTDTLQVSMDEVVFNNENGPVVLFSATDSNQTPIAGLRAGRGGNLRFSIATLIPGEMGNPSYWKNYVKNDVGQATYEREGTLEDFGNGKYSYTFEQDITTDPDFNPVRTHRVAIQIDGFQASNPTLDFRPDGGSIQTRRDIVKTASCNTCHNKLSLHGGGRVEIKYCTTCHTQALSDPDTGNSLDFAVMIHKIHRGERLPSVAFGPNLIEGDSDDGLGVYQIIGFRNSVHDYSTVSYPQDIRNCVNCHDGSDPETPQGDNWKARPSIKSCGSCHDNIDFSRDGSAAGANDPRGHSGGIVNDNTECLTCHAQGRIAGSVVKSHEIPGKETAKSYAFKINEVTGGNTPIIRVSVINPLNETPYDFAMGDETTNPVFKASNARVVALIAWSTSDNGANVDYNNIGSVPTTGEAYTPSSAPTPAQPISINFVDDCSHHLYGDPVADPEPDWLCADLDENKIFTLTKQTPLPAGAVGTGRVAIEGHPALPDNSGRMIIKSVVADFAITDAEPISRREVVDIDKCNQCHDQLSLHGSNRTDEVGLCVMCHNPSLTDISYQSNFNSGQFNGSPARPKALDDNGDVLYATASPLDGKAEESADFKVMIHGIHAGDKNQHGFRENGIQLRRDDFSHVRFPGILSDCQTCHLPGTYLLEDSWETPTANGLQSTTTKTTPAADSTNSDPVVYGDSLNNQVDDLRTSPTAAACAGCHDSQVAQSHMTLLGGAVFGQTQAYITNMTKGNFESCAICHGPGHIADVQEVHYGE